ncbi:MAG: tetratricopeptide repeat protein [Deltaproteobacteria bacterium]|nr:tetratricopeptide repeat protein [Deltaproteobacteria bacterium]
MSDEPEITVHVDEDVRVEDVLDRDFCYATIRKLRAEIDSIDDDGRAGFLCFAIGWIFERQLGDTQQAATHYQEAVRRDPDLVPALRALRRRVLEQGNWTRYLQLIDQEFEQTRSDALRAQLLVEKAEVLDTQLDDAEGALDSLDAALEADPTSIQALWRLESHHRSRRNVPALARTLDRIVEVLPASRLRRNVRYEAARLREVVLDDPVTATRGYEEMLADEEADPRARAALRRQYLRAKAFDKLVEDLRSEARGLEGHEKGRVLYTVAKILNDRMGELVESISALEYALEADPDSSLVIGELVRLYPLVGKLEGLASCYRKQIDLSSDAREKAALYHRLGQLYDDQLRDDEKAEKALGAALEVDPENRPALASLAIFYQRRGRLDDLVTLHLKEAETTESPMRCALAFHRGAEILEGKGDDARAAEQYGRALEALPTFVPSFNALEQLLERLGDHEKLAGLLRDRAGREDNPVLKARILARVARLHEEQLGDRQGAMEVYRGMLEVDPTSSAAVGALVRLTRELEQWEEHVEFLGLEADFTDDDQHVVSLLLRMGEIQEQKLGQELEAVETYRKLMSVDPFYPPAIRNLGRLLHRLAQYDELINLHRQELDVTTEADEKSLLHYKIGKILEERMDDLDEAASAYKAAIFENPRNFAASWSLYRIFLKREDWLSIIDILENEANALPEGVQRALALVRIGELWEEPLERLDMAADAYMQSLRVYPGCREAREALIRLSEQDGNWDYLADLLYQEFQTSVDAHEQYRLAMQLGELALERSNNPRKAMEWYMKALELQPGSMAALRGTEHALRAAGEWRSFLEVQRKLMDHAQDEQSWLALFHGVEMLGHLHLRGANRDKETILPDADEFDFSREGVLGDLLLERQILEGGDPGILLRYFEARGKGESLPASLRTGDKFERACALLRVGMADEAMDVLEELADEGPGSLLALLLIQRIAEHGEDHARVVEISSRLGDLFEKPAFKAESLVRRAAARLENPEERQKGIADLEEALRLDPENAEAFTSLVQAMGSEARWDELVGKVGELADKVEDKERSVDVFGTLGSLQWKRLGDPTAAIKSFNRVLKHDARHAPTLMSLLDLYTEQEQENEAITVARHLISNTDEQELFVEASIKLADLLVGEDRDVTEVAETLQGVLDRDPDNKAVLERMASLYRKSGDLKSARDAMQRLASLEEDPGKRAALLVDQAEIVHLEGGGHDASFELLGKALDEDPGSERAIGLLCDVLGRASKWKLLTDELNAHLERIDEDDLEVRSLILTQLSSIYQDHLEDDRKAAATLEQAFELDPSCGETGRRLVDGMAATDRLEEALEVGQRMLEDAPLCFEVLPRLVELCERKGNAVRAGLLAQVPFYFDIADETATRHAAWLRSVGRDAPLGPIRDADVDRLRTDAPDHPARRILECLGRPGSKVLRKNLKEYSVERGDRLTAEHEQGAILVAECARAAHFLGVGDHEVYLIPSQGAEVVVEMHEPPALLFSVIVTELSEVEQRVLAVQALCQVRFCSAPAHKLGAAELEELFIAAARLFHPDFASDVTGVRRVDELRKALDAVLTKKQRKELKPLVDEYRDGGWLDFEEWHFDMQATALRLALLACGDPGAVLDAIKKRDPELLGVPLTNAHARRKAFERSDLAMAVLRFIQDPETVQLWTRYSGKSETR